VKRAHPVLSFSKEGLGRAPRGHKGRRGRWAERYDAAMEAAIVALVFPVVRHLLANIGLPWMRELSRYTELDRRKVLE